MTKHKHPPRHPRELDPVFIDVRHPAWQRAYRDLRFLAVVFLMLAAILVYAMTGPGSRQLQGQALPLLDKGGK